VIPLHGPSPLVPPALGLGFGAPWLAAAATWRPVTEVDGALARRTDVAGAIRRITEIEAPLP